MKKILISLILIGFVWTCGVKPFLGEMFHTAFRQAMATQKIKESKDFLNLMLLYDPDNTAYKLEKATFLVSQGDWRGATQEITETLQTFNGDVVPWGLYFHQGLLRMRSYDPLGAIESYQEALKYNPKFYPAIDQIKSAIDVLSKQESVIVPLRR